MTPLRDILHLTFIDLRNPKPSLDSFDQPEIWKKLKKEGKEKKRNGAIIV